jgi:hypothetical protein
MERKRRVNSQLMNVKQQQYEEKYFNTLTLLSSSWQGKVWPS